MDLANKKKLENDILNLFQEKGLDAKADIEHILGATNSAEKRLVIRQILSRLHVKKDGTYFFKE